MILFDISSGFHITTHRTAKLFAEKGQKIDLHDYRAEFMKGLMYLIDTHIEQFKEYGEPIICFDDKTTTSWRKQIYPMYKATRKAFRESQTTFDYADAYDLFDQFSRATIEKSGIRCISAPGCEADDVILTLADHCNKHREPCMIISPDKDFIQVHGQFVKQYSWMHRKTVEVGDKGDTMEEWLLEHICLGDQADNVPRIVDFQEFNPGVKEYLVSKGIEMTPLEFSGTEYDYQEFEEFGGVFKREKFGAATLKKLVKECGGIEQLLESRPAYRLNYFRNRQLVLLEGLPRHLHDYIVGELNKPTGNFNIQDYANALGLEVKDLPLFLQNKYITTSLLDW